MSKDTGSLSRRDFVKFLAAASAAPITNRLIFAAPQQKADAPELVHLDPEGVIRWNSDGREVALFGANYCLPSGCDYRAAGLAGADRKTLIRQDIAHFARMGWDALRLSFWGDWENSDAQGNLIVNDHLDLLDYLIAEASSRGVYMLLSPIVTYNSLWPELIDDPAVQGFSRYFDKSVLGTDPQAIAAQTNYLRQLLRHVNPYTKRALKAEPHILFIEMINEPTHHSNDFDGSVRYINALVDAVRSTGCDKILFHNLSQDFGIAPAIAASKAQGGSIAWYPSGLDMRGQLHGNFLRYVDTYPTMPPELARKAKVVYEFDMPDVISGYHYPAMAREFRAVGAQFAAMFSYDEMATAPYNGSWQVHCLNMVYTPQKAASAIIAGEVMRQLPRLKSYGAYPDNTHFGDFRVSYEENLSEMITKTAFLYSGDTPSRPPALDALQRVVGFGSSPVVRYEGEGLYFLDRVRKGVWRLEVYPDATQIADPFLVPRIGRTVFQLTERAWLMQIKLPDLGTAFRVSPLNTDNHYSTVAKDGRFSISPGVYLLTTAAQKEAFALPERIGRVGMREFVCPPADKNIVPVAAINPSEASLTGPLTLFDASMDMQKLDRSRASRSLSSRRNGPGSSESLRLSLPPSNGKTHNDVTASLFIGDRIAGRGKGILQATTISVTATTDSGEGALYVTLVEKDGTAWGGEVMVGTAGDVVTLPLSQMKTADWVMLPQGYPGEWSYWASPTRRTGSMNISEVERLQLSVRNPGQTNTGTAPSAGEIVIGTVTLV